MTDRRFRRDVRPFWRFSACVTLALSLGLSACGGAEVEDDDNDLALRPRAAGAARVVAEDAPAYDGTIDRGLLDRVLAAGPGWLLSQVRLDPTFTGKHKFAGFRIGALFGNEPKVLRYGVLPGDLLRAINGQPIVTPGDLLLVWNRLKTANFLDIDVRRGERDLQFRFPVVPEIVTVAPPAVDPAPPTPAVP